MEAVSMGKKKAKANYRRTVLRLPDLDHSNRTSRLRLRGVEQVKGNTGARFAKAGAFRARGSRCSPVKSRLTARRKRISDVSGMSRKREPGYSRVGVLLAEILPAASIGERHEDANRIAIGCACGLIGLGQ